MRVRDDGKGIDPKLLTDDGREGHFGLRGMQERAKLIGGKLTVWSELDSGTEVELSVAASRAYMAPTGQRSWLTEKLANLSRKDTELRIMNNEASPIRILVVDDHPVVRAGIVRLVGGPGGHEPGGHKLRMAAKRFSSSEHTIRTLR